MSGITFPRVKKGKISKNSVQMAVYVPSTEFENSISKEKIGRRVTETVNFLNRTFGGSTRVKGTGSWEDNGKTINEEVTIVETYATVSDYKKAQNKLKSWLRSKKSAWKQYVLSFEFENDLYFVKG